MDKHKILEPDVMEFMEANIPHDKMSVIESKTTNSIYVNIDGVIVRFSDHITGRRNARLNVVRPSYSCEDGMYVVLFDDTNIPMVMNKTNLLTYLQVTVINLIMYVRAHALKTAPADVEQVGEEVQTSSSSDFDLWKEKWLRGVSRGDDWQRVGTVLGQYVKGWRLLRKDMKAWVKSLYTEGRLDMSEMCDAFYNKKFAREELLKEFERMSGIKCPCMMGVVNA